MTVYRNEVDNIQINNDWISRLKEDAKNNQRCRSRLLLHKNEQDSVQEMLIVFRKGALIRPHQTVGKPESIMILEGKILMIYFDSNGNIISKFELGDYSTGLPFAIRLTDSPIYCYKILSDEVVIHETTSGPFNADSTKFPAWAPEDEKNLNAFLQNIN